ncbi:MAG: DUF3108 domain-containing protein [Pseudomonadales bacterium]
MRFLSTVLHPFLFLVFAMTLTPFLAHSSDITDSYAAEYEAEIKGLNVRMHRSFTVAGTQATIEMKAQKLIFKISESSTLQIQQDGILRVQSYKHNRRNLGERHNRDLLFDWQDNTVSDALRPEQDALALEFPVYDKVSYQEQFRLDLMDNPAQTRFEYQTTDGKSIKLYAFDRVAEETIETPLGELSAVKFKRDRGPESTRETYIWFAKDLGYLLAQLDQIKDGKLERLMLRKASINGTKVKSK